VFELPVRRGGGYEPAVVELRQRQPILASKVLVLARYS